MSLRARLTLASAGAVALAVVIASTTVYFATQRQLVDQVDDALTERLQIARSAVALGQQLGIDAIPLPRLGAAGGYVQIVRSNGEIVTSRDAVGELPPTDAAWRIASIGGTSAFETVGVDDLDVRVLTAEWRPGVAIQFVRPLDEVDLTLRRLRNVLVLVTLGATALAGLGGWLTARIVVRPVAALTATAERVTRTSDLTQRIPVRGRDELNRLARSFNTMLEALETSMQSHRALVADASHELRTPLTSLRTNIDVLMRADALEEEDRIRLAGDIDAQIAELAELVGDVIELARGDEPAIEMRDVRLDELVESAVERAELHWPDVRFAIELEPTTTWGAPDRLARAVDNLLDNAGKWSPAGATVTVRLSRRRLEIDDEGPGVRDDDAAHVFERFWRAPEARALPGSGLGLAIVRQVVDQHGGKAGVAHASSGGARFWIELPEAHERS